MPVSPTFSTNNTNIKYNISVTETAVNEDANSSTVNVKVTFFRTNNYTTYGTGTCYCKINGTTYSQAVTSSQKITVTGIVLFNKTVTIPHDSNGQKTIYVSAWISHSQFSSSEQGFSVTLTPISVKPTAPTSFTISAGYGNYVGLGDNIDLRWSGASGNITGYEIQYSWGNSGWQSQTTINSKAVSQMALVIGKTDIKETGAGKQIKYRIRAFNGSTANASAWKESNTLTMLGGMDLQNNNAWKTGTVWINVNGSWKRAKRVWIKQNNTWKYSI